MATANAYRLVKSGQFKGQQKDVYDAIVKVGRPFKVADLIPHLKTNTVQTPERIAAYYVCVLKKSGHLEVATADAGQSLAEFYAEWEAELEESEAIAE